MRNLVPRRNSTAELLSPGLHKMDGCYTAALKGEVPLHVQLPINNRVQIEIVWLQSVGGCQVLTSPLNEGALHLTCLDILVADRKANLQDLILFGGILGLCISFLQCA